MRESLEERFERSVDRAGEHHRWNGAANPERGTGRLKVGGLQETAHRVAWELVHGPVAPGSRILPFVGDPACVRVEHLSLAGRPAARPGRAARTPEVAELTMLLHEAVEAAPDVALLAIVAVTGMRRGELVGLRRSRIHWDERRLVVDSAFSGGRLKSTKTRRERSLYVDEATLAMLRRHCDEIDERARIVGAVMSADPYVFTLALDGSVPMSPDYLTRRVGVLKGRLGIEEKKPDTIAREDEALRLFRQKPACRPAMVGPAPKGAMSLREIGATLGRSERWAALAVASAERREMAGRRRLSLSFDGSILALRKFTSSELLDAGFNVSTVAQRKATDRTCL